MHYLYNCENNSSTMNTLTCVHSIFHTNMFNFLFVLKIIIVYTTIQYFLNNSIIHKCLYLYLFFLIAVCLLFVFDVPTYFGFLIFIESTVILFYFVTALVFFNYIMELNNRKYYFIYIVLFFNTPYVNVFNYLDFFTNYLTEGIYFKHNEFTGLYFFFFLINIEILALLLLLYFVVFYVIFFYVTNKLLKNQQDTDFFKNRKDLNINDYLYYKPTVDAFKK